MCGINGILSLGGREPGELRSLLGAMNDAIVHRGPDDEGIWCNPESTLALGHRRLSILDLTTAGHQPMATTAGTTIVFNGEIYNFRELRRLVPDFEFKSESDTEIILALYERFGEHCLEHLNGMFAFAIWDPHRHKLFLARDRVGKKPLYYCSLEGGFAFSSELRSLLTIPGVQRELDRKALYEYLTFSFVPLPRTMFVGIMKLPPGCKLEVSLNGVQKVSQYWEVEYTTVVETDSQLYERFREAVECAVKYRMVSDVPVGAFLSGGVDSSAIVALMGRDANYPIKTFSIGFEGQPDYDELHYAKGVAQQFGTDHHECIVTRSDIVNFLPNIVEVFDEPMADPTCIPIYFLARMAKDSGLKVVLNGDGPDELLLGYRNWMKYVRLYPSYRRYSRLPQVIKKGLFGLASKLASDSPNTEILYRALRNQELFWGGAKSFKEWNKRKVLDPQFMEDVGSSNSHDTILRFRKCFESATDTQPDSSRRGDADWMSYLGLKHLIPNFYTYRSDRLCMAHSVEARSPFLDFNFVNLALSVHSHWKTKGGEPKHVLKKALEPLLPKEVLYRKKKGFCVPIREWGADVICDAIEDRLPSFCSRHRVFNQTEVLSRVTEMRSGNQRHAMSLWSVFFILSWADRWLTNVPRLSVPPSNRRP